MASTLPSKDTCCSPCDDVQSTAVPGPKGDAGADGSDGTDGENAYTTLTSSFDMPSEGSNVQIEVGNSDWMGIDQILWIESGGAKGHFQVISRADSTHATIQNLEDTASGAYDSNSPPTTTFAAGGTVSPAGLQGASGSTDFNAGSPTTTKGDILVDDGSNSPDANMVREPVGSDGQVLHADSALGTGVGYKDIDLTGVNTSLSGDLGVTEGGTGASTDANARANLGVEIGSDVQGYDDFLTSIAALGTAADKFIYTTALDTAAEADLTAAGRALLDDADASAQRTTLGLDKAFDAYYKAEEQQAAGTDGGGFTSGAWQQRTLTEVTDPESIGSVVGGAVQLGAGTYQFRAFAIGNKCDGHATRLQNTTDATTIATGSAGYSDNATSVDTNSLSHVSGRFTLAGTKNIELQHQCATTQAADGFGKAANVGVTEVYAKLEIWRESG